MECFHGIVSFGHGLAGELSVEGEQRSFDAAAATSRKDWGKAFPAGYVWMASNHIDAPDGSDTGASFIGSVAIIPWLGGSFRGFIVGLKHSGKLHRWTTYTRARERRLEIDEPGDLICALCGPRRVLVDGL